MSTCNDKLRMMEYNLEGKIFKSISNTENGDVDGETIFTYHQLGQHVWAEYSGGKVIKGNLLAIKNIDGSLDMNYQHINKDNEIMVGKCHSIPSLTSSGKLQFKESWQWLNGDYSKGVSLITEI